MAGVVRSTCAVFSSDDNIRCGTIIDAVVTWRLSADECIKIVTIEEFKQQLKQDPRRIGRLIRFAMGLIVGLTFLIFGTYISGPRAYVLRGPVKTVGRVTGSVRRSAAIWNAQHTTQYTVTGYHPTVEFQAGGRLIGFEDWRSTQRLPPVNSAVPVIYDPRDPSKAMIDLALWNFIPWAPITVVGLLLFLNALRYWPTNQVEADGQPQAGQ